MRLRARAAARTARRESASLLRLRAAPYRRRRQPFPLALPAPDRDCLFAMRTAQRPSGDEWSPDLPSLADRIAGEYARSEPPDWMSLDTPLSSALSERILLSTPAGYFHLQKPISFYALAPHSASESSND